MKAVDAPDIDVVSGAASGERQWGGGGEATRRKPRNERRLPHEKGFHVSWDQIHRDCAGAGLAA